jgi:ferrous iron transport protein B
MELPPYKRPLVRIVLRHMWDRSQLFLRRAGTVILGITILLWFLMTYPKSAATSQMFEARRAEAATAVASLNLPPDQSGEALGARMAVLDREEAGARLRDSFAGRTGRLIEPTITPLGFDWKIGIGLVASFAAREVFVSTMSQVYNVGDLEDSDEGTVHLAETLRSQSREDGSMVYTTLVGLTLMVFYVFALQCVSTIAVVRRETNGWKWPVFQWVYMGILAWVLAFITYQGGKLLGWA